MKLLGLFKNKKTDLFLITETDRLWVEDNFKWLISVFGYPSRESTQILLTNEYFPQTLKGNKVLAENIIIDLCSLFQIQEERITFEFIKDIRDSYGLPYEIQGKQVEISFEFEDEKYRIQIANFLQNHPNRLIYSLIYEFIRIKLTDNNLQYDSGNDTDLFIYLAGIYFGFGVLLSQNLKDIGKANDGFWETKWNYISEMPYEIMAFALAIHSSLIEEEAPNWMDNLPSELAIQYQRAQKYLVENPSKLYDKKELEANELFRISFDQYQNNEFEEAITSLKKILFLTNDDSMKADVFNNIGYYNVRLKNFEQSIPYFRKSLQIHPDYGFANDNLGFALIQIGEVKEGKECLDKAMDTGNNDIAYTYRNLALYYQAIGEVNRAEEYFKKSFESKTDSVELLEYHYSEFLISNGQPEKGFEYLKMAVEKGEPEAIEKMKKN